MRLPLRTRGYGVEFNMTPMIDVVFLLIIFFLVSSHLAKQETQLELPLPVAESGEEAVTTQVRRLTLNVRRDGSLLLAGKPINQEDLLPRLAAAQRREAELEVRIRSHREVPYRFVQPVMLSCARAGIWKVTFAVYRPEDAT